MQFVFHEIQSPARQEVFPPLHERDARPEGREDARVLGSDDTAAYVFKDCRIPRGNLLGGVLKLQTNAVYTSSVSATATSRVGSTLGRLSALGPSETT